MDLDSLTEKIRSRLSRAAGINARVKFDFGEDGIILVDGTQSPAAITHEDGEADTVFQCAAETFDAILEGKQDPNLAFMMGKLKIRGSMGIAMKLNAVLED